MKDEYDFSQARRGAVVETPPGKTRITIRLDDDVLAWFKQRAHDAGGGYQSMINAALRSYIEEAGADRESFERMLRRVLREELRKGK